MNLSSDIPNPDSTNSLKIDGTETPSLKIPKREIKQSSKENYFKNYQQKVRLTFGITIISYLLGLISAVGMIVISFCIVFLPAPSFYQKVCGVGMFIIGIGLILIFSFRNPMAFFRQFFKDYNRVQIVLSTFQVEQNALQHMIEILQNQDNLCNSEKLILHLKQLDENAQKAIKDLNSENEWLD